MDHMYVAFLFGKPSFIGRLIQFKTSSWKDIFSGQWKNTAYHVEVGFGNNTWYSADLDTGVWRKLEFPTYTSEWRVARLLVSSDECDAAKDTAEKLIGSEYDWVNIIGSDILGTGAGSKDKVTCDEGSAIVLTAAGYGDIFTEDIDLLNPAKLERLIANVKLD